MNKLKALGADALKSNSEEQTFNIKDVETRVSKTTGNVGYRVKTDQGKTITFWDTTMDLVIEEVDEAKGIYGVVAGTTFTEDGGLIPKGKASNGFWS